MDLGRPLGDPEIEADLLVQLAADQVSEDLALARRQQVVACAHLGLARAYGAAFHVARDGACDGIKKHRNIDWLRQEVNGSRLHRAYALRNVGMAGQEHDRQRILR
jgi:hypothetical protein